jgi:TIR domain
LLGWSLPRLCLETFPSCRRPTKPPAIQSGIFLPHPCKPKSMPPSAFQYAVFLSHNRAQKDWTRELARRLRDDGFRVWFDPEHTARPKKPGRAGNQRKQAEKIPLNSALACTLQKHPQSAQSAAHLFWRRPSRQPKSRVQDEGPQIANIILVGATGFEPVTPCAQGRCATRLRYAPTG